jgi:hypothetical protein
MCCHFSSTCYIPPTNLTRLMHVKQAWLACPKGCPPILLGDLNINPVAPCNNRYEMMPNRWTPWHWSICPAISCQCCGIKSYWGRWMWQMRMRSRWVSSQYDYILRRATNLEQIWHVSVLMPLCHNSNHRALFVKICAGGRKEMTKY